MEPRIDMDDGTAARDAHEDAGHAPGSYRASAIGFVFAAVGLVACIGIAVVTAKKPVEPPAPVQPAQLVYTRAEAEAMIEFQHRVVDAMSRSIVPLVQPKERAK